MVTHERDIERDICRTLGHVWTPLLHLDLSVECLFCRARGNARDEDAWRRIEVEAEARRIRSTLRPSKRGGNAAAASSAEAGKKPGDREGVQPVLTDPERHIYCGF